jgi:hypothetical protein
MEDFKAPNRGSAARAGSEGGTARLGGTGGGSSMARHPGTLQCLSHALSCSPAALSLCTTACILGLISRTTGLLALMVAGAQLSMKLSWGARMHVLCTKSGAITIRAQPAKTFSRWMCTLHPASSMLLVWQFP